MKLMDIIKQASVGVIEAGAPVSVVFGTVTKTNPLEVSVEQRLPLTEDFLTVPETLTRFTIDVKHTHGGTEALTEPIVIRPGLAIDDKLILLRIQGGDEYLILDKVV